MECTCEIECCDGEPILDYEAVRLTVQESPLCDECGETIPKGAFAERVTGLCEGEFVCWYTCEVCLRIRDDLMGRCFCHGTMRDDLRSCRGVDYVTGEVDEEWEAA